MKDCIVGLLRRVVIYGGLAYILVVGLLFFSQNSMLYLPEVPNASMKSPSGNPAGYRHPSERALPSKDVSITTSDNLILKGWLLTHKVNAFQKPTILFFHENAGNIGIRIPFIQMLYQDLQVNVLMVAYRGYSDSEGTPSEEGLSLDAEAIFEYLENSPDINPESIFLFGRSLGGAVAIDLAAKVQRKLKGIIIENTFTSISGMVDQLFPFLKPVKWLVLRNHWPSLQRIQTIHLPMLFISATDDEIVPPGMMEELTNAAKKSAAFVSTHSVKGGTHNDSWLTGGEPYLKSIRKFLRKASQYEQKERPEFTSESGSEDL